MSSNDTDLQQLAASVQRLEDIEAIKVLKHKYGRAADPTMKADEMCALYVDDTVINIERFGRYEGLQAIRAFMEQNAFAWMFHCMIPQIVEVDGDGKHGSVKSYLWELATMPGRNGGEDVPLWCAGAYDDEVVKVDGEWKFKAVNLRLEVLSPYDKGWVKQRFVEMG